MSSLGSLTGACVTQRQLNHVRNSVLPTIVNTCMTLQERPSESCNFQDFPQPCEFHLLPNHLNLRVEKEGTAE